MNKQMTKVDDVPAMATSSTKCTMRCICMVRMDVGKCFSIKHIVSIELCLAASMDASGISLDEMYLHKKR